MLALTQMAPSASSVYGIDVGTSGVKALAIDERGRVLARAEAHYSLSMPHPGWAEQDPEDWWMASEHVLSELLRAAGPPAGIGLSGQMHGLVALDGSERVLRPAILWNDQRTRAECAQIERTIGRDRLIGLTGNRALPGFTAPKLLWLRDHEPDVYRQIARIALPKDTSGCASAASTRPTSRTHPGRCCSTSPSAGRATRSWASWRSTVGCSRRCSRAP